MQRFVTEKELEAHKLTIQGPNWNESFYVYGEISLDALKDAILGDQSNEVEVSPKKLRRGRPRKFTAQTDAVPA